MAHPALALPGTDDSRAADSPERAALRSRWARLLARIYEVFLLRCPECGSDMRILACLTDPGPRVRPEPRRLTAELRPELCLAAAARTRLYALQPQPWSRNHPSNWPTTHTAMALDPFRHAAQGEDRP